MVDVMSMVPTWNMVGQVTSKRELTSDKNKNWKGHVFKVMGLGLTVEVSVTEQQFATVNEGQTLAFTGHFENQGTNLRWIVDKIQTLKAA